MKATKESLRALYATHPVCPDCSERAVRPMDESGYRCDACETELGDDEMAPYTDGKVRVEDKDELYDPDLEEIDDIEEPELGNLVGGGDVEIGEGASQLASSVLFGSASCCVCPSSASRSGWRSSPSP